MKKILAKLSSLLLVVVMIAASIPAVALPTSALEPPFTVRTGFRMVGEITSINGSSVASGNYYTRNYPISIACPKQPTNGIFTVSGWAMVQGGQDGIVYSVDGGTTWIDAKASLSTGTSAQYAIANTADTSGNTNVTDKERVTSAESIVLPNAVYNATIDLSAYAGQTLDIKLAVHAVTNDASGSNNIEIMATITGVTVTVQQNNISSKKNWFSIDSINGASKGFSSTNANHAVDVYSVSANALNLVGWTLIDGGQGPMFYSYDGGKTWNMATPTYWNGNTGAPGYWDEDIIGVLGGSGSSHASFPGATLTNTNTRFCVTIPVPGDVGSTTSILLAREALAQRGTYSRLCTLNVTKTTGKNAAICVNHVNGNTNTSVSINGSTTVPNAAWGFQTYDASSFPAMSGTRYTLFGWAFATDGQGEADYIYYSLDEGNSWYRCDYVAGQGGYVSEPADASAIIGQAAAFGITNASSTWCRFQWVGANLDGYQGQKVNVRFGMKTTDGNVSPLFQINNISVPSGSHTCTIRTLSTDNNGTTHSGYCLVCHKKAVGGCTITGTATAATSNTHTGTCRDCAGSVTQSCTPSSSWTQTSTQHYKKCTACSNKFNTANHSGTAATCTTAQTCSTCGYTMANKLGHNYSSVVTAPTCTAQGYTTHTCSRCNDTYTDAYTDAKGHSWNSGSITTNPTCTATGVKTFTCSTCRTTKTETVPATGHSYGAWTNIKAATCTATGTDRRDCNNCDHYETRDVAINASAHTGTASVVKNQTNATCGANGYSGDTYWSCCDTLYAKGSTVNATGNHTWNSGVQTTAPTCVKEGVKTYTCSVCGGTKTEPIAATGIHTWNGGQITTAPTCVKDGVKTYTCSVCGGTKTETITATGSHSYDDGVITTKPTCITNGVKTFTCSVCGDTYTETVNATGTHTWNNGVVTTNPTCTEKGVKTFTCTVSGCGATYTEEVAATGHDYSETVTAPTCTAGGYTTYTCSCGDTYTGNVTEKLGHSFTKYVPNDDATCTEDGTATAKCDRCDETKTITNEGSKLNHSIVNVDAKAPTCEGIGWDAYEYCDRDGCDYTTYSEKAAIGHDWDDGVITTDPTCTEKGVKTFTCQNDNSHTYTEEVAAAGHTLTQVEAKAPDCVNVGWDAYEYCSVCDYTTKQEIAALGHNKVQHEAKAPTCTEIGWDAYVTCSRCSYTTYVEKAATDHSYDSVVTAPTCEADGYTTHTCSKCGDVYKDSTTAKLGHDWDDGVETTAPTCEGEGVMTYTCKRDNSHTKTEAIDAKGHTAGEVVVENKVPATCTDNGSYDEVVYCTVCKAEMSRTPKVDVAPGTHDGQKITTPATCETAGSLKVICSRCGYVAQDRPIPALGHNFDYANGVITKAPTCTETGVMTYTCQNDASHTETEEIPMIAHTYNEGEITTSPDCTNAGVMTFTCSACGNTKTEAVDSLGHTEGTAVIENNVVPTCTAGGSYETVVYCSVCDAELSRVKTTLEKNPDAHTGEANVIKNNSDATCTTKGYTGDIHWSCCDALKTKGEEIAINPNAHTGEANVIKNKSDATCTTKGYTGDIHWSCCDALNTKGEEIAINPNAHTTDETYVDGYVAPTCTTAGATGDTKYSCCDAIKVASTVIAIDPDAHTTDETYVDGYVAPTCTEKGATGDTKYSCCDAIKVASTEIAANGHTLTQVGAKAPTCTEIGWDAYEKCSVCSYTTYVEKAALGHTEGAVVEENRVAAGCVNDGSYDNVVYCTVCGAELSRTTVTVDALGHTEGAVVEENRVAADCVNDGSYDNVVYCTVCNAEISRTTVTVNALGHTEVIDEAVAADCENTGLTEGKHCSVCDKVLVAQEVVAATGHAWTNEYDTTCDNGCGETRVVDIHTDAIGVNGDSYTATTIVNGNTVTIKANGTVKWLEGTGAGYSNWIGFKITAPEGVDPADVTITRPDGAIRILANILDGVNYAHMYYGVKAATTYEYKVDWNSDGINEITVVIDATDVCLASAAVIENKSDATCTEDGTYDSVVYCSVCGKELSRETIVSDEATGHTEVVDEAVAADCENTGLTEGKHCDVCGEILVKQTVVNALGHTEVIDAAVAADCENTGLTEGKHCYVCDKVLVAQEVTKALGHTEVIDAAVAPTYNSTGLTEGKHCDVCGKVLIAQEEIPALPGVAEINGVKYGTLTDAIAAANNGDTINVIVNIDVTAPVVVNKNVTIDLGGYTVSMVDGISGKCVFGITAEVIIKNGTVDGNDSYAIAVGKTGVYGNLTIVSGTYTGETTAVQVGNGTLTIEGGDFSATATDGDYRFTVNCIDNADAEIIVKGGTFHNFNPMDNLADGTDTNYMADGLHAADVDGDGVYTIHAEAYETVVTAPDCINGGYTTYTCSVCGDEYVADEVDALGHTEVIDAAVAADCENTGLTEGKHCDVCGEILVKQTVVNALGHTEVVDEAVAADCENTGLTEGKHCSVCDKVLVAQEVTEALGHEYDDEYDLECNRCEHTRECPHKYDNNCDADCNLCGEERTPADHVEETVAGTPASCNKVGLTDGVKCSECGKILVEQTSIPALRHNYVTSTVEATCTTGGYTLNKCENCSASYKTNRVSAKGHDYESEEISATCTTGSYTLYTCKNCTSSYKENYVSAGGHKYTPTVTDPTCTTRGYTTYTCKCGIYYTDDYVPATGHKYTVTTVEASCSTRGYELHDCDNCDMSYKTNYTSASGHVYVAHVTDATCTTRGYTEYTCSCGMSYKADFVAASGHTYVPEDLGDGTTKYTCECGKFYVVANP